MRIWGTDPTKLCRAHLLGEHRELHTFIGTLRRGISISGYTSTGLLDIDLIIPRHIELVTEMARRGYTHKSPIDEAEIHQLGSKYQDHGYINIEQNEQELRRRCDKCSY